MSGVSGGGAPAPAQWLAVRRVLAARRAELGSVAAGLYGGRPRAAGTELRARPEWLPAAPLSLAAVPLRWQEPAPAPAIDPAGPLTAHVRPWRQVPGQPAGDGAAWDDGEGDGEGGGGTRGDPGALGDGGTQGDGRPEGGQYATYAEAIGALDRPALYEDRACYRLLDARLAGQPGLTFSRCSYFDGVSLGHAVAHELAAAWLAGPGQIRLPALPLRAAADDPCDLARRCAIVAVTTLTLRREPGGAASFVLHWRDPAKVNHAGGLYQVLPVGIFQPVTAAPAALRADLSLWRCMVREFSEELLGTSEDYPARGGVLDYQSWPFYRRLAAARAAGTLTVWCVGAGVDPLTLATDILTVAVLSSEVFDAVFGGLVAANAEGRLVRAGGSATIPFTGATVARFTGGGEPVQAAGAAVLRLAWQHRQQLLG